MSEELARSFLEARQKILTNQMEGLRSSIDILSKEYSKLSAEHLNIRIILNTEAPKVEPVEAPKPDHYIYKAECTRCSDKSAKHIGEHNGKWLMLCLSCSNEFLVSKDKLKIQDNGRDCSNGRDGSVRKGRERPQSGWNLGATDVVMNHVVKALDAKPEGILFVTIGAETGVTSGVVHYALKKLVNGNPNKYEIYKDQTQDRKCMGIRVIQ